MEGVCNKLNCKDALPSCIPFGYANIKRRMNLTDCMMH